MIRRNLLDRLRTSLRDTPVVVLHGARQVGKSTLARRLVEDGMLAGYWTLDDASVLAAATHDPTGFLAGIGPSAVVDEVQRAPELLRAVKAAVDRDRSPGRYLLTGSSDAMFVPEVADALAGRMDVLVLAPFTQGELAGVRETLIDRLFDAGETTLREGVFPFEPLSRGDLGARLVAGGYPEVLQRTSADRRAAWFENYVASVVQRDIRSMADIEGIADMPRLLALLAAQHGGLLNMAELSRDIGFSMPTVKRYLALLRATHLYQPLPAWSGSARKRLVKSDRVFLNDSGLLAWQLGLPLARSPEMPVAFGTLLESFVVNELRRQASWSRTRPAAWYYRTSTGHEVDLVLEARGGAVVGVEVKSAATIRTADLRGLSDLRDTVGARFRAGIVVHPGERAVPMGDRIWAVPVSSLWGDMPSAAS